MKSQINIVPFKGFGLGLRVEHYQEILEAKPSLDWLEIITENYLQFSGKPNWYLNAIQEIYPLVMHGVSLSIASADKVDFEYLKKVKKLSKQINPLWISDHLCWTGVNHYNMHDLYPVPYTEEFLSHVVKKIKIVQDFLERPLVLENVSSYIEYQFSAMSEWNFIKMLSEESGCLLLVDVNNIYVNSQNHNFSPTEYLNALPTNKIQQIHLAGHSRQENLLIDTHDQPIPKGVWNLYKEAIQKFGNVSTMIERDANIPPLQELLDEVQIAKNILTNQCEEIK